MANIWYWDTITESWAKQQGKSGAPKVLLCGVTAGGVVTPVLVDASGKLITTTS